MVDGHVEGMTGDYTDVHLHNDNNNTFKESQIQPE